MQSLPYLGMLLSCLTMAVQATATEPLHKRLDVMVLAGRGGHTPAKRCSEETFLRRVYLDFAGRIPTPTELREFLDDKSTDKRRKVIDRLLKGNDYARNMSRKFHIMLMERRGEDKEWQAFLESSFRTNKPWDQFVRDLVAPDADNEKTRGAAFFYTKRLEKYGQNPTDYPGLTRDVGRLLLGQDLQCAQCHDHLFIKDYRQADFQGLYSIFLNVGIAGSKKFPAVTEKPTTKKLDFVSVFDPTQHKTFPRIPGRKEARLPSLAEATSKAAKADLPKKGKSKPKGTAKSKPPLPSISGLKWLQQELPRADNQLFCRNIVNRLWCMMMGRGLFHPLDLAHSHNKPSHPELLDLLAREFATHRFDIKWLLRELALSETYQRSSEIVGKLPPQDRFLVAQQRRLSAESLADNILQATGPWKTAPMRLQQGGKKDAASKADAKKATTDELLGGFRKSLVEAIANPPREPEDEIRSTVKGALYLSNSEHFLMLLRPATGNLIDRLAKQKDNKQVCRDLFLNILSRSPSSEELRQLSEFFNTHKEDRNQAIANAAWALLCSVEFYVNH